MTVTLPGGGNVLLLDAAPRVEQVRISLGWNDGPGVAGVELDGVVILLDAPGDGDNGATSSRVLLADQIPNPAERLGGPPPPRPLHGDAQRHVVTLAAVPTEISRLQFGVAIYDAAGRRQTFRPVRGLYIHVLNHADGVEIARYAFEAETGLETAMTFGELYRHPKGWKFRAVGQGRTDGLPGLVDAAAAHADTLGASGASGASATGRDVATARPGDVADFLTRASPSRTRRNLAEHLHPSRATAPTTAPAPPASPARSVPAAARSVLDLSEPSVTTPAAAPAAPAAPAHRPPARVEVGERSSRHRQRAEQVDALDDDHPATVWTAEKRGSGALTVTLRWSPLTTRTGLPRPSDLHLGCLWQANDGAAGVIQILGNVPGALSAPGLGAPRQVLRLGTRDERDGETLFVHLGALATFRRFFVFAYGLRAAPEWSLLRSVLTVAAQTGEHLTLRLGDAPPNARICVVSSFHVVDDDLIIRRENDFMEGTQADAAERYGWSLEWNPDRTTPREIR